MKHIPSSLFSDGGESKLVEVNNQLVTNFYAQGSFSPELTTFLALGSVRLRFDTYILKLAIVNKPEIYVTPRLKTKKFSELTTTCDFAMGSENVKSSADFKGCSFEKQLEVFDLVFDLVYVNSIYQMGV